MVDELVGGLDDVGSRAIVLDEVMLFCTIVLMEAADETDIGAAKPVDVLVIVPHRQDSHLLVLLIKALAGKQRHQIILLLVDILVLIHKDVAETTDKRISCRFPLKTKCRGFAFEQCYRIGDNP